MTRPSTLVVPPTGGTTTQPARRHVVALPAGLDLLNANQRQHHQAKARLVKEIRTAAWAAARSARLPRLERAHILYVVHPNSVSRRRDPGNWAPSAKAAVDGLVDAGVLDDDNSTRLLGPDPRLGSPVKGYQLVLVVTDLTAVPDSHLALLDPTHQLTPVEGRT
ncbi:hypothetical protein [Kitasatospora sp. NPDC090091]|uniref:hypothetical protein n=1 Tax=Kitasatospora sp. NPDC090091 TaxID=3364081 RepID=UPI0037F22C9A